jgi:hypothetical protein
MKKAPKADAILDNAHQVVFGVVLLSVIGTAYGGTFLLRVFRNGVPTDKLQKSNRLIAKLRFGAGTN